MALPRKVEDLLLRALVAELSVIDRRGSVVTYPLIPLYDGNLIYMTSSILFSRKLKHIKANPKVAVSLTDVSATRNGPLEAATIQGDARVRDDDLHAGWMFLLPLWRDKEPVIEKHVRQRFAMPLFWERAVIEVEPRRVLAWEKGGGSEPSVYMAVAR